MIWADCSSGMDVGVAALNSAEETIRETMLKQKILGRLEDVVVREITTVCTNVRSLTLESIDV